METGLLALLILLALEALLRRRFGRAAFWLCLAGLTRPEGLIMACAAWLTVLATTFVDPRLAVSPAQGWRRLGQAFTRAFPLALAIVVGLVPAALNWAITGTPTSAGLESKAWFYNVPRIGCDIVRSMAYSYGRVFVRILNGWDRDKLAGRLVAPGLTVLSILGWVALGARRKWMALLGTASWFWLGTLSTATLMTATWHLGRYQAPFVPIVVIVAVAGIQTLWEGALRPAREGGRSAMDAPSPLNGPRLMGGIPRTIARLVSVGMLAWLLGTSLLSTYHALSAFRQTLRTTARQQLALADWVREHIPVDARVGVTDIGVLRYVGQRATYDLVGLTTAEATEAWRHGAGSIFEQMEDSPLRPDYFATYADVMAAPYLAATDLFAQELFTVRVDDYAITSAGPVQKAWLADWRLAGSGNRIAQADVLARTEGLVLVDALDMADLEDEDQHHVQWWHGSQYVGFPTEVHQQLYRAPPHTEVLDGGRLVSGGITFQVETQPGYPLWIVARLHARQAGAVRVTIDGCDVGRWAFPDLPGAWLETLFRVPAEAIAGTQTQVRLELDPNVPTLWLDPAQNWQHYAPYYYWFLQGDSQRASPLVSHPLEVAFDQDVRLVGFDLDSNALQPGQVLSTTLYWRTVAPTESTARVFLHLYDAQGDLKSQSDGWPVFGTRPPFVWQPGETVVDQRALALPPDLSSGRYSLEVGLYDADGRLTPRIVGSNADASRSGTQGWAEKRVRLTYIEVDNPR
jgi:hypothetical protein